MISEAKAPKAFAIPIYYYLQFMRENGFDLKVDALLQNPEFNGDPAVRDTMLFDLRL